MTKTTTAGGGYAAYVCCLALVPVVGVLAVPTGAAAQAAMRAWQASYGLSATGQPSDRVDIEQIDIARLRVMAGRGDARAQTELGERYEDGRGVGRDYEVAVSWFRQAAEQGHAPGQAALGFMYSNGHGVPRDDGEAVRLYRLAADQGDAHGQNNLGLMYEIGRGVPRDDGEAVRLYRLAADQGDAVAQHNLGLMYSNGRGVLRDDGEAVRLYRLAADQGDATAQAALGWRYETGRGVPLDDGEAVRLYRLAADQGDAVGQRRLGFMYSSGRGVPLDDGEAVRLYRLAADQGDAVGQRRLGFMYSTGRGVPLDHGEAVRLYRLAADQGEGTARFLLCSVYLDSGSVYSRRFGVPLDDVRLYRLAADQLDASGQRRPRDDGEAAREARAENVFMNIIRCSTGTLEGREARLEEYLARWPEGRYEGWALLQLGKVREAIERQRLEAEAEAEEAERLAEARERSRRRAASWRPGQVVSDDCDACPELVVIPAGEFMMGSPASEEGRRDDEGPQHRVTVRSFALGVTEVTLDEWEACVRGGGCKGSYDGVRSHPVHGVSWLGAQTYVSWLSAETGAAYRLPSESEWEYAARAGTTTPFHTGATISTDQANYASWETTPVGAFAPNAFGLYDMHGNVWEWVEDRWHRSYRGAPSDGTAWMRGGEYDQDHMHSFDLHVLRGGSWFNVPQRLRSASRSRMRLVTRHYIVGFRVARTLD